MGREVAVGSHSPSELRVRGGCGLGGLFVVLDLVMGSICRWWIDWKFTTHQSLFVADFWQNLET